MKNIIVYSKSYCPYCKAAKALLGKYNLPFEEIEVSTDAEKLSEMIARSNRRTVPQIFFDNEHIGGYDDLVEYFRHQPERVA